MDVLVVKQSLNFKGEMMKYTVVSSTANSAESSEINFSKFSNLFFII